MFGLFPVYATTAANPYENSHACYYDSKIGTYLGDVYSVNWMENTDEVGVHMCVYLCVSQCLAKAE